MRRLLVAIFSLLTLTMALGQERLVFMNTEVQYLYSKVRNSKDISDVTLTVLRDLNTDIVVFSPEGEVYLRKSNRPSVLYTQAVGAGDYGIVKNTVEDSVFTKNIAILRKNNSERLQSLLVLYNQQTDSATKEDLLFAMGYIYSQSDPKKVSAMRINKFDLDRIKESAMLNANKY